MRRRRHLLPLALALALLAAPSSAGAYVFWAAQKADESGEIGRANLDGSGVVRGLAGNSFVASIAVDAEHLYFHSQTPGGEGEPGSGFPVEARTNLDAGERLEIPLDPQDDVQSVDGEHVYWLSNVGIGRAKLDGSDPEPEYLTGLDGIGGYFTTYGNYLYWTEGYLGVGCAIGRANLSTKAVEPEWVPECSGTDIEGPKGIAADSLGVFWNYLDSPGAIGHVSLDGGGVNPDFIGGAKAFGAAIAIDGPELYYASDGSIGHAHLEDGGAAAVVDTDFVDGFPKGVAALAVNSAGSTVALGPPPPPSPIPAPTPPPAPAPGPAPLKSLPTPRLKLNTKTGAATLSLTVPGPGQVVLTGAGIKRLQKTVKAAGPVTFVVRPAAKTAKKLNRDGKARVTAKLTFTPSTGDPTSRVVSLTLKLRPGPRRS